MIASSLSIHFDTVQSLIHLSLATDIILMLHFFSRAAYFRLKSQYDKLCSELTVEKDVERSTMQKLEDAE